MNPNTDRYRNEQGNVRGRGRGSNGPASNMRSSQGRGGSQQQRTLGKTTKPQPSLQISVSFGEEEFPTPASNQSAQTQKVVSPIQSKEQVKSAWGAGAPAFAQPKPDKQSDTSLKITVQSPQSNKQQQQTKPTATLPQNTQSQQATQPKPVQQPQQTTPQQKMEKPIEQSIPKPVHPQITPNIQAHHPTHLGGPVYPVQTQQVQPTKSPSIAPATSMQTPQPKPVLAAPVASKHPVPSHIPARTFSAPPNLEEQEKSKGSIHGAEKNSPLSNNANKISPNSPPFFPTGPVPVFLPHMPSHTYTATITQPPQSKRIPIIDPNTGEEVKPAKEATRAPRMPATPGIPIIPPAYNAYSPMITPGMPFGYQANKPYPTTTFRGAPNMFPEMYSNQAPTVTVPLQPPVRQPALIQDPNEVLVNQDKGKGATQTQKSPAIQEQKTIKPEEQQVDQAETQAKPVEETKSQEKSATSETVEVKPSVAQPEQKEKSEEPPKQEEKPPTVDQIPVKSEEPTEKVTSTVSTPLEPTPALPVSKPSEPVQDESTTRTARVYSLKEMLQLQQSYTDRPQSLPQMNDIIGDEGLRASTDRSRMSASGGQRFNKTGSSSNLRPPPGYNQPGGRQSGSKGPGTPGTRKQQKRPGRESSEPGLAPTPGRWEPNRRGVGAVDEKEAVLKKAKGLLNKLTEEKFDQLSEKLLTMRLDDPEILSGVIKLVYDKAVWEPKFVKMYADLCRKLGVATAAPDAKSPFRRLLLNRCQEEFEASFTHKAPERKLEELSKEERAKMEEEEFLTKRKMLGNITFIGELFKTKMLTEKIMHECITRLLGDIKNPSHDDMEALCKLMTTIGKDLDHAKAKEYMETYFARMKELSRNKALPSRIRFMIQDVIVLRQNNWHSKKEANIQSQLVTQNPQKTDKKDQPIKQILTKTPEKAPKPISRDPSASPDWEVVGNKSKQRPRYTMAEEEVSLRPQGAGGSLYKGASGFTSKTEPKEPTGKGQRKVERKEETREMDLDELQSKLDEILGEYFSSNDVDEAVTCIKELRAPKNHPDVISQCITIGIEKKDKDREKLFKLFSTLHEEKIMTTQDFISGLKIVFDVLEDLAIDTPKAPTYVGDFIGQAVVDGCIPLEFIYSGLEGIISNNQLSLSSAIVTQAFRNIAESTSHAKLRDLYNEAKLDITKFIEKNNQSADALPKFLEKEKLTGLLPSLTYEKQIQNMIKEADADKITSWIDANVPKDDRTSSSFCTFLVRKLLDSGFKQNSSFLKKYLYNRSLQLTALKEIVSQVKSSTDVEDYFKSLYDSGVVTRGTLLTWSNREAPQDLVGLTIWIESLPANPDDEDDEPLPQQQQQQQQQNLRKAYDDDEEEEYDEEEEDDEYYEDEEQQEEYEDD